VIPRDSNLPGAWRRRASVTALFIGLTALMTWPQPLVLGTHTVEHQDVFFNLWRLRWIAHALATSPSDFFNGNQFYPEPGVLAFSDAMPVEGLFAAPLLWIGVAPILVHNLVLLGAIAASGVGMFALARHLSGSWTGSVAAGIVFAFAPYRFDHYMHMELQWIMWAPWACLALQRTLETGDARHGILLGTFVVLQMMSSVYYGVFLTLLLAVVAVAQLLALRPPSVRVLRSLAIAGLIAGSLSAAYSLPYSAAARRVGERGLHEIGTFSARARDYRVATRDNLLYGSKYDGAPERRLFPGVLPLLLALVALLLVAPKPATIAYLVGLVVAFELSLGFNGQLYPFLHQHVSVFRGLRAPARASVFSLLFLGVLAAQGCAAIEAYLKPRARQAFAIGVIGFLLLEYWVAPLRLVPLPNHPPPLYAWLARMPRGLVAEFPMPLPHTLPGDDPRYAYMSTFHWMPLLNGYSGYYPGPYLRRLTPLARLPEPSAIEMLKATGVRYVIIHAAGYEPDDRTRLVEGLVVHPSVTYLGDFKDGWGDATVFGLR
jgi:hypothetical protein